MLLETLDIKKNDILIYSTNRFDLGNNFKIIYKQSSSLKAQPIHFDDIEQFIKNPYPKNIILYRLLTNLSAFDANLTRFGISLLINNNYELVYYDPVFVIKDLEDLRTSIDFNSFRFKIQQIGLTSFGVKQDSYNFSELYTFDLKADEARNQNDKIFADAIFALNDAYKRDNNETGTAKSIEKRQLHLTEVHPVPERRLSKVSAQNLNSAVRKSGPNTYRPLSEVSSFPVNVGEKDEGISEQKKSFNEFLHSQKQSGETSQSSRDRTQRDSGVFDMFKTASCTHSRSSEEHIFRAENTQE